MEQNKQINNQYSKIRLVLKKLTQQYHLTSRPVDSYGAGWAPAPPPQMSCAPTNKWSRAP